MGSAEYLMATCAAVVILVVLFPGRWMWNKYLELEPQEYEHGNQRT